MLIRIYRVNAKMHNSRKYLVAAPTKTGATKKKALESAIVTEKQSTGARQPSPLKRDVQRSARQLPNSQRTIIVSPLMQAML